MNNPISNWRKRARLLLAALALAIISISPAMAQQEQRGVCARVKIEILQELTLERIGFLATLEITNNDGEDPVTDFSANLTFENPALSTNGIVNDASSVFFVRAPELENINSVDGSGVIRPTTKAVIQWFIIPKIKAGGITPEGVRYFVGAKLSGKMRDVPIPEDVLLVIPDQIWVKPEPQLEITYFQPRDVQGDDPFTETVESPIPFTLGVLVKNSGYGMAKSVKIDSQQPRIVENKQNLLLIARLLGTRVNDAPLDSASLLVNLGDIPPGGARKGAWDMITSLSGEFVEFKASYTHASDLGGEETSVIKSLEAHFIANEVMNDQAGRDELLDFLADTDRDADQIPDALYESEGNILPVNHLKEVRLEGSAPNYQVQLTADRAGWGYMRVNDPGQGRLRVTRVVRSDGKVLHPRNYWTNVRFQKVSNNRLDYFNILDLVELGTYTYTVTFEAPMQDVEPPVTTIRFAGDVSTSEDTYYITPETQIYFTSEDANPVSIVYSITNSVFLPALPFTIRDPGVYPIVYYATDASGNREDDRLANVVVSAAPPEFVSAKVDGDPLFVAGEALSIRPDRAELRFAAAANPTKVNARLDIFEGVKAWVSVAGVPSSPTSSSDAVLTVTGEHVDYYKYKLDSGNWSEEQPASAPIELSALSPGEHRVFLLGRSSASAYLAESNAVQVSWTVAEEAPATRVTGAPATPSRQTWASLNVGGEGVTDYRWKLAGSFFRPESAVSNAITLTNLPAGQQSIEVLGKVDGVEQPAARPTVVNWSVDPLYGFDYSDRPAVRTVAFEDVGASEQTFVWDGRNDQGVLMTPGWYTARLTLSNELGRSNFVTRLIRIGEIAGAEAVLAGADKGAQHPHARGHLAVWQDQSAGNWRVMLQVLDGSPGAPMVLSEMGAENPKTDGRWVVWQGRRADGTWDIWARDTQVADAIRLTDTADEDEIKPAIDWPWVVYQVKPLAQPEAPWQLKASNLASGESFMVLPGTQDQIDADVQAGRLVWQDHRDVGFGEIYFKNLETSEFRRLTTSVHGQYHPAIHGRWVVWQDNRDGQVELYGYDLLRGSEVRVTSTPENEARPYLEGEWAVCEEDSLGVLSSNLKLVHLSTGRSIPLTRSRTLKSRPALAGGRVIWQEQSGNAHEIASALLPAVQAVFRNQNAIVVTEAMARHQLDAHTLLTQWHSEAGVVELTTYRSLVPELQKQTVRYANGNIEGANFALQPGTFLWVRFEQARVLDLGLENGGAVSLSSGVNVLSYAEFPSGFSAYALLRQLGLQSVRAVRMLDAESGRWEVAQVIDQKLRGRDFAIPKVAVVMLDMAAPVSQWRPQ